MTGTRGGDLKVLSTILVLILLLGILSVIGYGVAWTGDAIMDFNSDSMTGIDR